jgi:hypothetical protein
MINWREQQTIIAKALDDYQEITKDSMPENYIQLTREAEEVSKVLRSRIDKDSQRELNLLADIRCNLEAAAENAAFKAGFLKGVEIGAGKVMAAMILQEEAI